MRKDDRVYQKVGANTFMIRVMFDDNCSFQGEISWLEGEKTLCFRSVVEMIALIREAAGDDSSSRGYKMRSWSENGVDKFG